METKKCSNCGFDNPDGMKFCGNCGKPLIEMEQRGERKIISILYVDIVGFTTISETMDPEKVQDMLNTIFENISDCITRYGGTVHKYIGDEVMALFGAPIAYENHAERAAHAAIEINKSIKDITEKINLSINLHIALHSGEVVLGHVGSEDIKDYTVIGDTVNVASRLEKIAPTDKILVSKDFYERTKHAFEFDSFGEIEVKGKSKPITCYLLNDIGWTRKKIRGIKELETPLLGRKEEIEFLTNKLKETKESKSLNMIIIKGQPGIGKSRLFHEFGEIVNRKENLFFETRSLPFGQEELHPFKQLIRNITSVSTKMTETKAKESVENSFNDLLGTADLGVLDLLDIILDFISIKELEIEPKRKQQIMFYMMENLIKKLSEKKTLIVGFEDFHWADSSSLLLLRHLINFLQEQPILFILITRPLLQADPVADFLSIFSGKEFSSLLELKPLDTEVSLELIATLLSVDKIPSEVKQKIVKRGEGNPLFIEEVLKVLMDKKLIYREGNSWLAEKGIEITDIPQTINEIVMGRIDLLQSMEKSILQYASVMGRIFWDKPIREAFKQTMINELSSLSTKGFVEERVNSLFEDAKEYIFNHILIQETVYSGILKRVRKKIHADFANWLETNYPAMKNIISNLLAFHFERGEVWEEAGCYYLMSGEESSKNYNNDEAIDHFHKALEILKGHHPESTHFFEIYKSLGKVLTRIGKNNEAEKYLSLAIKLSSNDLERFAAEKSLANLYQKMSLYDKAMEKLHLAKSHLQDKRSKEMVDLIYDEIWLNYLTGNIKKAFKLLDDFEEIYKLLEDKLEEKKRENLLADYYSKRAMLMAYTGDRQEGLKFYSKALNLYERHKSYAGLAAVYNNSADIYHIMGECSKAIEMYEKSQELFKKMGNRLGTAIGCNNLAEMYIFLNDFEKAEDFLNKYLDLNKKIHNRLGFGFAYLNFGTISEKRKNFQKALDYYKKALSVFEEVKSTPMVMSTYDSLAWLYFEKMDFDSVGELIEKISKYLEETKNLELKASITRLNGKLMIEKKDYKNAEISLKETYAIFDEMSNTSELISLCCDFIDLYSKQGNEKGMTKFKKKGKKIVDDILSGIKEPELKKSFLEQSEVKKLLYEGD